MNQKKVGAVLSYLSIFLNIGISLIYTPAMIRILGQSEYGVYTFVISLVAYLNIFNLGFGNSYVKFHAKHSRDKKKLSEINGLFFLFFFALAFVVLVIGLIIYLKSEIVFGSKFTPGEFILAKRLLLVLVFNLSVNFINILFNSFILANEKFIFNKIIFIIRIIISPIVSIIVLIKGYGSVGLVTLLLIFTTITLLTNIIYSRSKLNISFKLNLDNLKDIKEVLGFSVFIFINMLVDQINWSVDKYLLGLLKGTTSVAIYGLASQINIYYIMLGSSVSQVLIPKTHKLIHNNCSSQELNKLFLGVGRIQYMILMLPLSGFIFFGKRFISLWVGDDYISSYLIVLLLICPVFIPLLQNIGIEIQRAKDKHKFRAIVYLIIAILNIFVSIPLIKIYGPVGAAIGTTISLVIGNGFIMNWYYKKLGLKIGRYWLNIISLSRYMILPVIVGIIYKKISFNNFYLYISFILLYIVVYLVSCWFLGINSSEKKQVLKVIRR